MMRSCVECAVCHTSLGTAVIESTTGARVAGVTEAGLISFMSDGESTNVRLLCDTCDGATDADGELATDADAASGVESAPEESDDANPTPE